MVYSGGVERYLCSTSLDGIYSGGVERYLCSTSLDGIYSGGVQKYLSRWDLFWRGAEVPF